VLLQPGDALAIDVTRAIKTGDIDALRRLIEEHAGLAAARIAGREPGRSRTVLHQAADWPGFFANATEAVRVLVAAGAEVDARTEGGSFAETPLHWAASTDDLEVAETLCDLGADIEAQGASIAGGPPLDDAVGYGCWQVAHFLVRRGARVDRLWHASALGLLPRLRDLFAAAPPPSPAQINQAFWHACSGAQRRTAEYLLAQGADINFVPDYSQHTPLQAVTALETRRDTLASWLRERGAR
jgi:ankyrin repeat protein